MIHNLDPVLIDLGLLQIRWYSLAYIFGIIVGWVYGKSIIKKQILNESQNQYLKNFDDLLGYIIIGIIIGGRLGYVIFYDPKLFLNNMPEIFKLWKGGMSFHGGFIGVVLAIYIFSYYKKINYKIYFDTICCVAPIGIFFGRIANFINGELYGKITTIYWGIIFPKIDGFTRHPSQLYEAILEGLVLFIILNKIIMKKNYVLGTCSYMFLILYGSFRIFAEIFREPDLQIGYLFNVLSMGTFLSILMIVIGIILFYFKKNENKY